MIRLFRLKQTIKTFKEFLHSTCIHVVPGQYLTRVPEPGKELRIGGARIHGEEPSLGKPKQGSREIHVVVRTSPQSFPLYP